MQDAFNLAWKLALVVKGQAAPTLLVSYNTEREQIGSALLRGTSIATRVALTRNPVLAGLRTRIAPVAVSRDAVKRKVARMVTEVSLSYKPSEWTVDEGAAKAAIKAGHRAPDGPIRYSETGKQGSLFDVLATTRLVLLVFAGDHPDASATQYWRTIEAFASTEYRDALEMYLVTHNDTPEEVPTDQVLRDDTKTVHQRYDSPHGGLLLIRPDGYVGFRAQLDATDALLSYVRRLFSRIH